MHVWSWFTLRDMLSFARPLFMAKGIDFRVLSQYTTRRRWGRSMKEFRVALTKVDAPGRPKRQPRRVSKMRSSHIGGF